MTPTGQFAAGNWTKYRIEQADGVIMQEFKGEIMALHLNSGNYWGFDEGATTIWRELVRSANVRQAFERMLASFAADPDELQRDLERFLAELHNDGMADLVPASAEPEPQRDVSQPGPRRPYQPPKRFTHGHAREFAPGTPVRRGQSDQLGYAML